MATRTRMQQLRDTAAQWTAQNPVLLAGEIGVELDTGRWKIGNGVDPWLALPDRVQDALAGYVKLPPGGTDGQVLAKQGSGLVWVTAGSGPPPSGDGALAQASATYKAAAKAAGTSRLRILNIGDSTNDGYGKPGGPDAWAKTWPLKAAALLRTQLGSAAGGRGWLGPSTPLAPGNYVWPAPAVSGGNGTARDDLSTQIGIPGALWLQKGHATTVDTVTFALAAGVTAVDVVTTGYSGNMIFTAANAGSSVTKDATGDRVITRVTNPGATLKVTGAAGVGFALLGLVEYVGDETAGVTQWNLSRGAMRAFEYAGWLTDGAFSLKPMIGAFAPHVALVCLGANDYPTRTTAQFGTALTTIFNEIRAVSAATEVVFIIRPLADSGATTWNTYNETLQSTAASLGARVLDARGLSGSGLYLADGVHFTEAGNSAMAALVLEYLKVGA